MIFGCVISYNLHDLLMIFPARNLHLARTCMEMFMNISWQAMDAEETVPPGFQSEDPSSVHKDAPFCRGENGAIWEQNGAVQYWYNHHDNCSCNPITIPSFIRGEPMKSV